jgi:Sigma-54 factor, Activator interacting domain (AID)
MATKAKTKAAQTPKKPTASPPQANGERGNVASYFKAIFKENPKLLKTRSNDEILQRWLKDHPGHKKVPEHIKGSLSNVKSILRKKKRKKKQAAQAASAASPTTDKRLEPRMIQPMEIFQLPIMALQERIEQDLEENAVVHLELLEEAIDDCMTFARQVDRDILATVIGLLRRARNQVVWHLGATR